MFDLENTGLQVATFLYCIMVVVWTKRNMQNCIYTINRDPKSIKYTQENRFYRPFMLLFIGIVSFITGCITPLFAIVKPGLLKSFWQADCHRTPARL